MQLECIIMAGGKGSRLYPLTQKTPKPLLPVNNIPNVVKILAEVNRCKIKKAVITTGYLGDELKKNIGNNIYDVEIKYAQEEEPLGSAGGVKNASKYTSGDLLVISGDAVFEGDLSDMIKRHYESGADLTIACTEVEDTSRFGVLVTDSSGRIVRFCEKPSEGECDSRLVNIGIYIISREIIEALPENTKLDFSLDVFPKLLKTKKVMAWKSNAYWCDMGTLSSYLECNMRYSKGKNIIGKNCNISPDAKISGSIIFDGVTVEANACICDAVICKDAHIGNGAGVARGSVIGENCSVSASEVVSPDSLNITRVADQEIMRNDMPHSFTMTITE